MPSAQDCATLLMETAPGLMRGLGWAMRQKKIGDEEPISMSQLRLMRILGHRPLTLSELATIHHVTPSTMSRSIDVLVRKAWVTRQHDPEDRRQVILKLTQDGQAVCNEMTQHAHDEVTRLIERLSADERARLYDGLQVLRAVVTDMALDDKACEPQNLLV